MWHWTCATSIFYKYYKIKAIWEEQTPVLWRFVDKPATNITTHATQNSNDAFGSRNVCMLYQNRMNTQLSILKYKQLSWWLIPAMI